MKHTLFLLLFCAFCSNVAGQTPIEVSFNNVTYPSFLSFGFEQPSDSNYFAIDSLQNANIWQIGQPQKSTFVNALSGTNSIVTDTVNAYSTNNVSSFEIRVINYDAYLCTMIQIQHRYETAIGLDGGTIEVSHDQGLTWINLAADSLFLFDMNCGFGTPPYTLNDTVQALGKPGFSGTSNGAQYIYLTWMPTYFFQNDTIDLRFTFASDSISESLDGWMLDDFMIGAIGEGVATHTDNSAFSYSPNPSTGIVRWNSSVPEEKKQISIYNMYGNLVASSEGTGVEFDWSFLPDGVYEVRTTTKDFCGAHRLLIIH